MTKPVVKQGRKKIPRKVRINTDDLLCTSRGPTSLSTQELEQRPTIHMSKAELQTLVDRNIDRKTMDQACKELGVSKTVYAGICASARKKVTESIMTGSILMIECHKNK